MSAEDGQVHLMDGVATEPPEQGEPPVASPPESPLVLALRDSLRALVDGPLTPSAMQRISHAAVAARSLLGALSGKRHRVAEALSGLGSGSIVDGNYVGVSPYAQVPGDLDDDYAGPPSPSAFGPAESVGNNAARQVIESMGGMLRGVSESPEKLVSALCDARRMGLTDVARVLEKKLGVERDPAEGIGPVAPAPKPFAVDDLLRPPPTHFAPTDEKGERL